MLSCLPPTINICVAQTLASGGDMATAIFNAIFGNVMGVFLTPILSIWLLGGGKGVSLLNTLNSLGGVVILPLILGKLMMMVMIMMILMRMKHDDGDTDEDDENEMDDDCDSNIYHLRYTSHVSSIIPSMPTLPLSSSSPPSSIIITISSSLLPYHHHIGQLARQTPVGAFFRRTSKSARTLSSCLL